MWNGNCIHCDLDLSTNEYYWFKDPLGLFHYYRCCRCDQLTKVMMSNTEDSEYFTPIVLPIQITEC